MGDGVNVAQKINRPAEEGAAPAMNENRRMPPFCRDLVECAVPSNGRNAPRMR